MGLSRGTFPAEMRQYIAESLVKHWKKDAKSKDVNELVSKLKEFGLTDSEISKVILAHT